MRSRHSQPKSTSAMGETETRSQMPQASLDNRQESYGLRRGHTRTRHPGWQTQDMQLGKTTGQLVSARRGAWGSNCHSTGRKWPALESHTPHCQPGADWPGGAGAEVNSHSLVRDPQAQPQAPTCWAYHRYKAGRSSAYGHSRTRALWAENRDSTAVTPGDLIVNPQLGRAQRSARPGL